MKANTLTSGLYIHVLVDQTDEMGRQHSMVEKRLDRLFNELQGRTAGGLPIRLRTIGMGRATTQMIESGPQLRFHLPAHPGCDLERSLQTVIAAVHSSPNIRHEVFILLSQEPGGRWHPFAIELQAHPAVRLMPFVFGPDELEEQSLVMLGVGAETVKRFDQVNPAAMAHALREMKQAVEQAIARIERELSDNAASTPTTPDTQQDIPQGNAAEQQPPPVTLDGVATIWKEIEPDESLPFRIPHLVHEQVSAPNQWRLIGASRRGKLHAHKGTFREDAFVLGHAADWHFAIVADGGGSYPLARVGSKMASEKAAETICKIVEQGEHEATANLMTLCQQALGEGLEAAWEALDRQSQAMAVPIAHFSTTFLALLYHPQANIIGVIQIGDGLLAAEMEDGKTRVLAEPDIGTTATYTSFLTNKYWQEWQGRIQVTELAEKPCLLIAMCDGVADDYIPYETHLPSLLEGLKQSVIHQPQPDAALLNFLNYEKRGSFDDRTLVLLDRLPAALSKEVKATTMVTIDAHGA